MNQSPGSAGVLLIKAGRVFDQSGNVDVPSIADILIIDGEIFEVGAGLDEKIRRSALPEIRGRKVDEVIDAGDRLAIPGFVNAHYHSHDVLLKGCFESVPLELWLMSALPPNYPKRSTAEIRARTLLGAIECLRSGITTVQDLATLYPFDEEHLDAVLQAYEDVGIRCVFALQIADIPGVKLVPFWNEVVPESERRLLTGATEPLKGIDLPTLMRDVVRSRQGRHRRVTWALGPSSPGSCSEDLLTKLSELSRTTSNPAPRPPRTRTRGDDWWRSRCRTRGAIGAIRAGMAADLSLLDLGDPSFVPLNSAARQLVFSECGRSVETVIVDGRVVVRDRKIMTIDERALREEVAALMKPLREDLRAVMARNQHLLPYLMDAHHRISSADVGINRYISG